MVLNTLPDSIAPPKAFSHFYKVCILPVHRRLTSSFCMQSIYMPQLQCPMTPSNIRSFCDTTPLRALLDGIRAKLHRLGLGLGLGLQAKLQADARYFTVASWTHLVVFALCATIAVAFWQTMVESEKRRSLAVLQHSLEESLTRIGFPRWTCAVFFGWWRLNFPAQLSRDAALCQLEKLAQSSLASWPC